jgi:hypothetical protein
MQKFKKLFPVIGGVLIAATLVGAFALRPKGSLAEAQKTTPKLEQMVKDLGMPYKAYDDGSFVVAFSVDDTGPTNIVIGESAMGKDNTLKVITVSSLIQEGSKDKKVSPEAMGVITSFDYQTDIGRVGVDDKNNVWYQSSLWESTLSSENLTYELCFAHVNQQKLQKKLKAIEEG